MLRRILVVGVPLLLLAALMVGTANAMPSAQADTADLSIAKTVAPSTGSVGNNFTYTLTVTNNGPLQATNVTVIDVPLGRFTLVSTTPSQGTCSAINPIVCNLGSLANAGSATVTIIVTPTAAGTLVNTATVSATEPDPHVTNNVATLKTLVNPADLSITKTASPSTAAVGANLSYTITATNHGPSSATGVTVADNLPSGLTFVSVTPSQGTCSATNPIVCNLGSLANAGSATVTIVVTPTAAGKIANKATVTANEPDPNPANNTSSKTIKVGESVPKPQTAQIKFTGAVQSLPPGGMVGTWMIQGLQVNLTSATKVKGSPQVGSFVQVEGTLTNSGVVEAKSIEVKGAEEHEANNEKTRPGRGLGDKNHEHSGPSGRALGVQNQYQAAAPEQGVTKHQQKEKNQNGSQASDANDD